MKEEIRKHLDELFLDAPKTRAAYELKEELLSNSYARYFDLLEDGIEEKEALKIVINSIGDVDQLFPEIGGQTMYGVDEEGINKGALLKSVSVGLFILSAVVTIAIDELFPRSNNMGIIIGMLIAAVAVSMLVYAAAAYPKYSKNGDTVVEEFKAWNFNQKKMKSIKGSIFTVLWMVVLILYFIISFTTDSWEVSWIIFLIGICAQAICNLIFQLKER